MFDFLRITSLADVLLVLGVLILLFSLGYFALDFYRTLAGLARRGKDKPPVGEDTVQGLEAQIKELDLALFMNKQRLEEAEADRDNLVKIKAHMELLEHLLGTAQNYIKLLEELRDTPSAPAPEAESFDFFALVSSALDDIGTPENLYEAGVYNGLASILKVSGEVVDVVDPKKYPQPAKPFARGKDGRFCRASA